MILVNMNIFTLNTTCIVVALAFATSLSALAADAPAAAKASANKAPPTYAELLAASKPADWRPLDLENTLYMELPSGRVIIELSPAHAPNSAANIRTLVREGYFDGLAIIRSQDNYVAQWGDPDEKNPRPLKSAKETLAPEFTRVFGAKATMPAFTRLPDVDGYAPQVGFSNGFPAGRDPKKRETWLTHCYGMVGVARGNEDNSGSGSSLYAITGHAPRQLDRNITVVGRVVQGMPLLSSLPRGKAALGFYETAGERTPIKSVRVAADVPAAERTDLEVIRTDTPLFNTIVATMRNRAGPWFKKPAGYIELCNVPIAVRPVVSVK
jgi:peptidylprolyl isomerase